MSCHAMSLLCMIVSEWNARALNSFFIWICFVLFFRIHCSFRPCALYELALLACYVSSLFWKALFVPMFPYRIITSLCSRSTVVILWFFYRRKHTRLFFIFFVLDFSLDFHVVNKFIKAMYLIYQANKTNCTTHSKRQVLKR